MVRGEMTDLQPATTKLPRLRSARSITKVLSFEGLPGGSTGRTWRSLLRLEKGFQAFERSGPGYIEELVRPVLAVIMFGKTRAFLVRGIWGPGRYGQYHVPRGVDFLTREVESDVVYVSRDHDPHGEDLPEWEQAVARKATPRLPEKKPKHSYDFLMRANQSVNTAYYAFIGHESNEDVFLSDDFRFAEAAAASFEREPNAYHRGLRDQTAGGETVTLIERLISHLEYLRDVYSADRETIKEWRQERLEAHDALEGVLARLNGDYNAYKETPEFKRWQAISDVGPLEYPLTPEERVRRDQERRRRNARLRPAPPSSVRPSHDGEDR
jgi:hypothetical protein